MQPNYDFSDAVKNPFAQRLKKEGHTVVIHHPPPRTARDKTPAAHGAAPSLLKRVRKERDPRTQNPL
jgi:hypothetical protein